MDDSRWALYPIRNRHPFNVIECKLMRVGEMEGRARGAPFCKKDLSFVFSK
jgi:hypothetical protein